MKSKLKSVLSCFLTFCLLTTSFVTHLPVWADEPAARIWTEESAFAIGDLANVFVEDPILTESTTEDAITIHVKSDSDDEGIEVQLSKDAENGYFSGSILLSSENSDAESPAIQVALGDEVEFSYQDTLGTTIINKITIIAHPIFIQVNDPGSEPADGGRVVLGERLMPEDIEVQVDEVFLSPDSTCIITPPHSGEFRLIAFPTQNSEFGPSETIYFHVDEMGTSSTEEDVLDNVDMYFRMANVKGLITDANGNAIGDDQYDIVICHETPEDDSPIQCEFVNEYGSYTLMNISNGNYYIKAVSYIPGQGDSDWHFIEITDETPFHRIDLCLTAVTASDNLEAQVQAPDNDTGVESRLRIIKQDSDWESWFDTDESGYFILFPEDFEGEGNYLLEAIPINSTQYAFSEKYAITLTTENEFLKSFDAIKLRNPVLTATIELPSHELADAGSIAISRFYGDDAHFYIGFGITSEGTALIPSLEDGRYVVSAFPPEEMEAVGSAGQVLIASEGRFYFEDNETPVDNITLAYRNVNLKGTVTDPDGEPVEAHAYEIWTQPLDDQPNESMTHQRDGSYIAGGFSAGSYKIALISHEFDYADTWYDIYINDEQDLIELDLQMAIPQITGTVVLPTSELAHEGWINILDENMNYTGMGTGIWGNGAFRIGGLASGNYYLRVELPNLPNTGYPPYTGTFPVTITEGEDPINMTLQMEERKPYLLRVDNPIKGSEGTYLEIGNASACDYRNLVFKISGQGQNVILNQYDEPQYDEFMDACGIFLNFIPAKHLPYGEYTLEMYEGVVSDEPLASSPISIACYILAEPPVISPSNPEGVQLTLIADIPGEPDDTPWKAGDSLKVRIYTDAHHPETGEPNWFFETEAEADSDTSVSIFLPEVTVLEEGYYHFEVLKNSPNEVFLGFGDLFVGETEIREVVCWSESPVITFKGDYLGKYITGNYRFELYMDDIKLAETSNVGESWGDLQWFTPYRLNIIENFTVKIISNDETVVFEDRVNVLPTLSCDEYFITEGDTVTVHAVEGKGWSQYDDVKVRIHSSNRPDISQGQLLTVGVEVGSNSVSFIDSAMTRTDPLDEHDEGITFPLTYGRYQLDVYVNGECVGTTEIYVDYPSEFLTAIVTDGNNHPVGQTRAYLEMIDGGIRKGFINGPDGKALFFDDGYGWLPEGTYRLWAEAPYYIDYAGSTPIIVTWDGGFFRDGEGNVINTITVQLNTPQIIGKVTLPSQELMRNSEILVQRNGRDIQRESIGLDGSYKIGGLKEGFYRLSINPDNFDYADTRYEVELTLSEDLIELDLTLAAPQIKGTVVLPGGGNAQVGWIEVLNENKNHTGRGTGIREGGKFRIGGLDDGKYYLRVFLPYEENTGYSPYTGIIEFEIADGVCTASDAMDMTLQMENRKPFIQHVDTPIKGSYNIGFELENISLIGEEALFVRIFDENHEVVLDSYDIDFYDDRDAGRINLDFTPAQQLPYGKYTLSLYLGSVSGTLLDERPFRIASHVITDPPIILPSVSEDVHFILTVDTHGEEQLDAPWQEGQQVKIRLESEARDPETDDNVWRFVTDAVVASDNTISFTLPAFRIPGEGRYYLQVMEAGTDDVFLGLGDFAIGETRITEIYSLDGAKMVAIKGNYLGQYLTGNYRLEVYVNGQMVTTTTEVFENSGDLYWNVPFRLNPNDSFAIALYRNDEQIPLENNEVNVWPTLSCDEYFINANETVTVLAHAGKGWAADDDINISIYPSTRPYERQYIKKEDIIVSNNQVSFVNASSTDTEFYPYNARITFPLAEDIYMLEIEDASGRGLGLVEIYIDYTPAKLTVTLLDENGNPAGHSIVFMQQLDGGHRSGFICGPDGKAFFFADGVHGRPAGTYQIWLEAPYYASGAHSIPQIILVDANGFYDENHNPITELTLSYTAPQITGKVTLPSDEPVTRGEVMVFRDGQEILRVPVDLGGSYKIGGLENGTYAILAYAQDRDDLIDSVPVTFTIEDGISDKNEVDLQVRQASEISGTVSLPIGKTAPEGGLPLKIAAIYDNETPEDFSDDMYYWQEITVPENQNSVDYSIRVADGVSYHVRIFDIAQIDPFQLGYVIMGFYGASGTAFSRARATLVPVSGSDVTGINIRLAEGHVISGTISLPEGQSLPEDAELMIYVIAMMDNTAESPLDYYGWVEEIKLTHNQRAVSYKFRLPDNPEGIGYTLEYELPEPHPNFIQNGYYSNRGTVARIEDHDRIDIRSGDVSGKDLTLLTKNVPVILNAWVDASGANLIVAFSEPLDESTLSSDGFALIADEENIPLDASGWSVYDDGDASTHLYSIALTDTLISKEDKAVVLDYDGTGSITSQYGIPLAEGSYEVNNLSALKLAITGVLPGSLNNRNVTVSVYAPGIEVYILEGEEVRGWWPERTNYIFENEGVHTLTIGSPNLLKKVTLTFTIDKTAPTVTITNCDSVTNDPDGVTPQISFSGDYVTTTITLNGERYTPGTPIKAPGHYVLIASAKDAAGNVGSATKDFNIRWDMTAPVISTNIESGMTYESIAPEITLASTAQTEVSNLSNYTYSVRVIGPNGQSATYTKGQVIPAPSLEGTYRLEIRAVNPSYTDITAEKTYEFTIDKTAPTLNITGVAADGVYNTPVTPVVSFTDTVASQQILRNNAVISLTRNGTAQSAYKLCDTLSLDGSYTLSVETKDNSDHIVSMSVSFTIDCTKPVITISGVLDGMTYSNTDVTVTALTNEGTLSVTCNGQPVSLVNNQVTLSGENHQVTTYKLVFTAVDNAGNTAVKEISFTIDRLPVNIVVSGISEGQLVNATPVITYLVYDGSEIKTGATATLDGQPYTIAQQLSDGEHTFTVNFVEGNTTTKTIKFIVDKTAPAVSDITLLKGEQNVTQNSFVKSGDILRVRARVTDANGQSQVSFSLGTMTVPMNYNSGLNLYEGTLTIGSGDLSGLRLVIIATDKAGNRTEDNSYTHTITIDNTRPTVNRATTPAAPDGNNGVYRSPLMTITLMSSSPNDTLHYTLNGIPGEATASKTLSPQQGDNVLVYYAVDRAGNMSDEKIFVFKYDSTPPSKVTLSDPVSAVVNTPKIVLTGNVPEEGATTRVLARKQESSELVAITNLNSDGSFALSDIVLNEGENRFLLYAVDYAGNVSASGTPVSRTLDSTAPIITIAKDPENENRYILSANEEVFELSVTFNGEFVDSSNITGSGTTYTVTAVAASGTNTLCVWATDAAGNTGTGIFTSTYIPANEQNSISIGNGATMDIPQDTFQQEIQLLVRTVDINSQISYKPVSAPIAFDFIDESGDAAQIHNPILIRIQIGLGLKGVMLMHIDDNGNPDEPQPAIEATSALDLNTIPENTPYYLTDTGELVFRTSNFSAYGAVVDNTPPIVVAQSNIDVNKNSYAANGNKIVLTGTLSDVSSASVTGATVNGQPVDLSGIQEPDLDETFSIVLPIHADGTYEVLIVAADAAGNQSNPCQVIYRVDITDPALTVALSQTLTNQDSVNLNIQTNEAVDIYINDELTDHDSGSFSIPLVLENDGTYNFSVRAVDAFGNSTLAPSVSVTKDTLAPVISISGVSDGDTYGEGVTISVNVTGNSEPPLIILDGNPYTPGAYATEGQHVLTVTASDEAGNTATKSVSFTIDFGAPVITLSGADANGKYSSDRTLDIQASNADTLTVTLSVNGAAAESVPVTGLSASVPLTADANSQNEYLLQVTAAKTSSGQIRIASSTLRVTIDKKAPDLTLSAPSQTESASVVITGTVDEVSDIYLNGELALDDVQAGSFSLAAQALNIGSNTFSIKAIDAVGHETTKTITITRTQPATPGGGSFPPPAPPAFPPVPQGTVVNGSKITSTPTVTNGHAVTQLTASDITKAMEAAKAEPVTGMKRITIDIAEVKDAGSYTLQLPSNILSSANLKQQYQVNTPVASLVLPGSMFDVKDTASKKEVGITVAKADTAKLSNELRDQIGSHPVIELTASIDGKTIEWSNPNAPVTVMIDYKPTAEELKDPDHIVVWYIDGNGKAVAVPSGRYDPKTGKVIITVTHFSTYAVTFVKNTYSDIGQAYAKKMIEALASRGFFGWIEGDVFKPDRNITRGEFMQLLVTTFDLKARFESNFDDVKPESSFYEAIGFAKEFGIMAGIGNNKSGADLNISRQDMATLVVRTLMVAGKPFKEGNDSDLMKFTDHAKISDYAKTSLAKLIRAGILIGSNNKIDPQGTFTMQQAATVIYRLYNMK